MIPGDKFILEAISPDNVEILRKWRNDPNKRQYFREYREITVDLQNEWYNRIGNNSNKEFLYFQVVNKSNLQIEGCCGLLYIHWYLRSAELSLFLQNENEDDRAEVSKLLCRYGFADIGLNKIWLEIFDNSPWVELYDRLGFSKDGVYRNNYILNGEFRDSYLFSMLKSEWFGGNISKP
jgi:RimJ/RimL family protein N-acetyltransferase